MNIQISRETTQVGTNAHFKPHLRSFTPPAFAQAIHKDKTVLCNSLTVDEAGC